MSQLAVQLEFRLFSNYAKLDYFLEMLVCVVTEEPKLTHISNQGFFRLVMHRTSHIVTLFSSFLMQVLRLLCWHLQRCRTVALQRNTGAVACLVYVCSASYEQSCVCVCLCICLCLLYCMYRSLISLSWVRIEGSVSRMSYSELCCLVAVFFF